MRKCQIDHVGGIQNKIDYYFHLHDHFDICHFEGLCIVATFLFEQFDLRHNSNYNYTWFDRESDSLTHH